VVHTIKTHVKVTIEPLISSLFMIIREVWFLNLGLKSIFYG
jgi:hypothetical protein